MGASAGLNLLLDRYHFQGRDWSFGPVDSPVQLIGAIEGSVRPEAFEIVVRGGCDLRPVDAGTAAGRLLLMSFVWPFDLDRHVRLASALAVVASHPLHIDQAPASDWLPGVWRQRIRIAFPWYGTPLRSCTGCRQNSRPSRAS
jgi:hypothetical protein